MDHYVERVVDLVEPGSNHLYNMSVDEARQALLDGPAEIVRRIQGSFALLAKSGKTVRMARSLDRPMRYFLAKRQEGPALVVASRIDAIYEWLKLEGLDGQFHPSYTRMVPAHHVVDLQLIGCPDPDPVYTRFFTPAMRDVTGGPGCDWQDLYLRAGGRDCAMAADGSGDGADRSVLFGWDRQRERFSHDVSRDAQARDKSEPAEGVCSGFG